MEGWTGRGGKEEWEGKRVGEGEGGKERRVSREVGRRGGERREEGVKRRKGINKKVNVTYNGILEDILP